MLRRLARESFEAFVALALGVSSASYLLGVQPPNSVEELLPPWLRLAWGIALAAGSLLILGGLLAGAPRVELSGCFLLAGAAFVYADALIVVAGLDGLLVELLLLAICAAALVRAMELMRLFRKRP